MVYLFSLIQVGNRSSEFHPDVRNVRRDSSYIYEAFMHTGGTDVKVGSQICTCRAQALFNEKNINLL